MYKIPIELCRFFPEKPARLHMYLLVGFGFFYSLPGRSSFQVELHPTFDFKWVKNSLNDVLFTIKCLGGLILTKGLVGL